MNNPLFVLVRDECEWLRFFSVKWQAYVYMWDVKNQLYSHHYHVKSYGRLGRNFVKSQYMEGDEIEATVYSVWEISYADSLNWMLAKNKTAFIHDWILNGSEYKGE